MTRRYMLLLAIAMAIMAVPLAVPPATAQAVDAPWPMWRQNPAHTGEGIGTAPKYLALKWKFKTEGGIEGSPSIVVGKVYFGSIDKKWYCLDAQTGSITWKYTTNWYVRSSPAIVDGKLYSGADDGNVYCLNANNGTVIWKAATIGGLIKGTIDSDPFQIRSSPCVVSGRLYVGHLDRNVYCLDATTGAKIWNYTTGGAIGSSPAVVSGRVYIGSGDRYFYCLNATTGNLLWRWNTVRPGETASRGIATTGQVTGSGTIAEGKVFFFANSGGRYWALNATTGNPIWLFWPRRQRYNYQNPRPLDIKVGGVHPGDQPAHDPIGARTCARTYVTPAYHDGNLYLYEDYFMQRLNAATGERYWEPYPGMLNPKYTDYIANYTALGYDATKRFFNAELSVGFMSMSSALYADGKMYIGSNEGSIYCNDALTGKRYSWYETDGFIKSSPSLAYGNVYVGSMDWNLYCFQDGGPIRDPWHGQSHRTATSITATLSSTSVVVDTPLKISGSVTPAPPADPYRGAPSVIAYFTRPDGTTWKDTWHLKSNSFGWYAGDPTYELSYAPDMVGTWTVKVRLHSMQFDSYLPSETTTMTFTVTAGSSSPTTLQTTSALTLVSILAVPAVVAVPIAALLRKRKK